MKKMKKNNDKKTKKHLKKKNNKEYEKTINNLKTSLCKGRAGNTTLENQPPQGKG